MSTPVDTPTATGFDPVVVREDFPILARVIDAEVAFLTGANSAVHRGAHTLAAEATELFEDARASVAAFVGAQPEQLVWTSGATAGLNLVAYGIGNATLGRGAPASERFALA